jgi:hypothetical protein
MFAMTRKSLLAIPFALALALVLAPGAQAAQGEWKFGLGTGLSSFSLDGEIGFPGPEGGLIFDVDLDNGDTNDLIDSGFGVHGFAAKGKWQIVYAVGSVTLEDADAGLEAEWERTQAEVAMVYNFAKTGNHAWGALFGVRHIAHDWTFMTEAFTAELDESWTDGIVGITHSVPFGPKWSWANRLDAGFGGSEGSFLFSSTVNWHFTKHWSLNFGARMSSVEFGDEDEIDNVDFYLYDVDEPSFGLGVMYVW